MFITFLCDFRNIHIKEIFSSEISGLQSELQQAHQLIDIQRGKFEMELSEGKEKIGSACIMVDYKAIFHL